MTAERSHPADAERFYHDVADALDGVEEVLVTGPASAKLEFIKYVHKSHPTLVPKIVGVETVDHPPTSSSSRTHGNTFAPPTRCADRVTNQRSRF